MASPHDVRSLATAFAKDHRHIPQLEFINADPDGVDISEVGDGNGMINYVYRVRSNDKKQSVILKHGKDFARMQPDRKVPLTRQQLEYNSLVLMDDILPGSVPTPYCHDTNHNTIAMADMSGWELLADQLEAGVVDMGVPVYLGHLLAKMHTATSRSAVSTDMWEQLNETFRNEVILNHLNDFLYDTPYIETARDTKVPDGGLDAYRQYVKTVKECGLQDKISMLFFAKLCFIHADLHWKSIFVKDAKAVLFDWEFAFMSHPGQNVGYVVESYIMFHIITQNQDRNTTYKAGLQAQFEQAISLFLESYMKSVSETGLQVTLSDIALFTGSSTFALSVFRGSQMLNNITSKGNLALMHTGFRLMEKHETLTSVDRVISAIFSKQYHLQK